MVICGPKIFCKRTVLVKLIIKNVVTCFLEHSVVSWLQRDAGVKYPVHDRNTTNGWLYAGDSGQG